jgi:hypothetical protein
MTALPAVPDINAALFYNAEDLAFLDAARPCVLEVDAALLLTDDAGLLPDIGPARRQPYDETGPDHSPVAPAEVFSRLPPRLAESRGALVVDMGWAVANLQGAIRLQSWGVAADRLARGIGPASKGANAETTKIFVAQGRMGAMNRQFRQALATIGAAEGAEITLLYRDLSRPR